MGTWPRSWWQKIKQRRVAIIVTIAIVVVAVALIIVGYRFDWTGFNGYTQVSTIHTISGPTAGTVTRTEAFQPGKTLWDWLQLLIIPAVLAVGGYVINLTISRGEQEATKQRAQSEREAADKRAETEREIASDNQRETALQAYIDSMAELLLHENLCSSEEEHDVRNIARVRTLTVLPRLDPKRKEVVFQFLFASRLIENEGTIIYLDGADLSGVHLDKGYLGEINLHGTNLSKAHLDDIILLGANLSEANLLEAHLTRTALFMANLHKANLLRADLYRADLQKADLSEADLSEANLQRVDLREADLSGANLKGATGIINEELEKKAKSLKGATMPNGDIHP